MEPIGGYFSIELPQYGLYHSNAQALNTGRNCLEYILRVRKYKRVYIPFFTCSVVLEPFQKLGIPYEFYHINELLEIAEGIVLKENEGLLYNNYFGLKQGYTSQLAERYKTKLIVDDTQAFFARPNKGVDTFYTCRKFFGVPDGAYLYTDVKLDFEIGQDVSFDRMQFLLKRPDLGAEAGYSDFREQSESLVGQPIKRMSNLTKRIMSSIDYQFVAQKRRENYSFLNDHLDQSNGLHLPLDNDAVPMVYPYFTDDANLKQRLIDQKIFVATYWPNVFEWCKKSELEYILARNTCFLPIDQRYGLNEMKQLITAIGK